MKNPIQGKITDVAGGGMTDEGEAVVLGEKAKVDSK
jgi:hypothetical protein